MARVRRRDTLPERVLRSSLHVAGLRFRVDRKVEGVHADIVFPSAMIALFVDGCFWHGCPKHASKPKSNTAYWLPKLDENKRRDRRQTALLRKQGWLVVRIWEHECRSVLDHLVRRISDAVERRKGRSRLTGFADGPTGSPRRRTASDRSIAAPRGAPA